MEHQGFPDLQAAIDASVDKDIIEIRTDRNVGGGSNGDAQRQLTIRAGAGYSPEVATIHGSGLNLEGLRFAHGDWVNGIDDSSEVPPEQIIRITNCVLPAGELNQWNSTGSVSIQHVSGATAIPIIFQNCWIRGAVELKRHPGHAIRFENCVLPRIRFGAYPDQPPGPPGANLVQFDRCAVWSPELRHGRTDLVSSPPGEALQIEVAAERTLFETRGAIRTDGLLRLSGTRNLFRIGNPYWFATPSEGDARLNVSCMDDAQQGTTAVTESFEGHPMAWEPSQWKLLPTSPGFQMGLKGKDVGADIEELTRVLQRQTTAAANRD
jgi:hypothetical protein